MGKEIMSSLTILICRVCGKAVEMGKITIKKHNEIHIEAYPCIPCQEHNAKRDEDYGKQAEYNHHHGHEMGAQLQRR